MAVMVMMVSGFATAALAAPQAQTAAQGQDTESVQAVAAEADSTAMTAQTQAADSTAAAAIDPATASAEELWQAGNAAYTAGDTPARRRYTPPSSTRVSIRPRCTTIWQTPCSRAGRREVQSSTTTAPCGSRRGMRTYATTSNMPNARQRTRSRRFLSFSSYRGPRSCAAQ